MTAAQFALDGKKLRAYAAKVGPKEDYPVVIIGAGLLLPQHQEGCGDDRWRSSR